MNKKEIIMFSDSELMNIHKALHDKRRKTVTVKGVKTEIFKYADIRQVKVSKTIFSEFIDNNAKFVDKATIAIKLGAPIEYWNVITNDNVYKNKRNYYASIQE